MNIIFASRKLEKYANDYSLAQRKLGNIQAKLYQQRLNDMYDAESFAILPSLPGNHHPLKENRNSEWACSLEQPSRLVYEPIIPNELANSSEQIELSVLKELTILEIIDYHEKKNKS